MNTFCPARGPKAIRYVHALKKNQSKGSGEDSSATPYAWLSSGLRTNAVRDTPSDTADQEIISPAPGATYDQAALKPSYWSMEAR